MGLPASKAIAWADVEAEYRTIRELIDGVRLPSDDEIDCYKASLAAPDLVSSNLPTRFSFGDRYPLLQGTDRPWILDQILSILGRGGDKQPPPKHIREELRDHIATIDQAIADRSFSVGFVYSWGEVQKAVGGLTVLLIVDDAVAKNFTKGMQAATKANDATLPRYWYAHWMARHGFFAKGTDKAALKDELAELCADIKHKRRKPRIHKAQWFGLMINRNEADPESFVLKTTYTRLTRRDIQRMMKNSLIPLSALPPLSAEEFPTFPITHPEGRKQPS